MRSNRGCGCRRSSAARKPTERLDAYDLYLRALAQSYRYNEEGFREAVVLARQALEIDPSYAPAAALVADRALHDQPRFTVAVRAKVVANAHLGRLDEARAEVGRMLALYPGLTIASWRAFAATPFAPELVELYVTGLRKAGLPEE